MKDLIKVVVLKDEMKLIFRSYIGEVDIDGEVVGDLSSNMNGTSLIFEDVDGNKFILDGKKFVEYVLKNKEQLIKEYKDSKMKTEV